MKLKTFTLIGLCVLCGCTCHEQGKKEWKKEASGIWTTQCGKPEILNLTSALTYTPRMEAINEMEDVDFPLDTSEIRMEVVDGKTYLRFPLEKDERIYGLGLNFKTVEQRGRIMRLHVDHYNGEDNGRTHAPVPFFVSSRGYGAFINSARYLDVYCGTAVRKDSKNPPIAYDRNTQGEWTAQPYSDNLEILVPAEGVELVLFAGKSMLDVVRRFNLYHGGGAMPPKWGLGFWHRVPTLYSDAQVSEEVEQYKEHGFPLSVIGLEPGWMTKAYPCTYEWNSSRFPDPDDFIKRMKAKNIEVNLWMNPGVSPCSEVYEKVLPYTASHTEWVGVLPDYNMEEARDLMCDHWTKHIVDKGVSGLKMDENDGYDCWIFPDVTTFPSGAGAEQMRQLYGSMMQNLTNQMYRARNQRTWGLVRSGNAGTNSFPYVIYNDYYNHRDFITALINSSFCGVLWTPEVRSSDTSEEWMRRMQTACIAPIAMLNAWADGTKPWSFPDVEAQVNEYAMLRMQLIPYLYSAYSEYCFQGIPPVRAMNLEEGYTASMEEEKGELDATNNPYAMAIRREQKDQFMVGKDILVAPFFAGDKERKVVFPQGKWYDFYTGELAGEGEEITIPVGERMPMYVRDGGIVPLMAGITTMDGTKMPLEIRHYGTKPGSYRLYDDDGTTFNYEKGEYVYVDISVEVGADGQRKGTAKIPEGKNLWSYDGTFNFRFM